MEPSQEEISAKERTERALVTAIRKHIGHFVNRRRNAELLRALEEYEAVRKDHDD